MSNYRYFVEPGDDTSMWRSDGTTVEYKGTLRFWHESAVFNTLEDLLGANEEELTRGELVEVDAPEGGAS